MKLSVIIVNYNVKFFLEQCLISVFNAIKGIESEVFVVDNASADGSCQLVRERFPQVKLICNAKNTGFSYANNQAIRLANGEYVLLLNPDTVVEEETFSKCIAFMDAHPEAGSLSVKMIDGKGRFLPESKRALPSPMVSFFKIFGFSKLFPRSRVFARYHLGHLSNDEINEIEILPGAFMFMRKRALDTVGLLDETFFMYGEDIDLSYRFLKAGYKNFYFPNTTIIHYKGESTKKGSINYVLIFYQAMIIFARKHFSRNNARLYTILIYLAIYFRAFLSLTRRMVERIYLPIIDTVLVALGFWAIPSFWERYWHHTENYYPDSAIGFMALFFILSTLFSLWFVGAFEKPQKAFAASKGVAISSILLLIIYGLLPEGYRYSRVITLLSSVWAIVSVQLAHWAIGVFVNGYFTAFRKKKKVSIVGKSAEAERVLSIVREAAIDFDFVGLISPNQNFDEREQIATIDQLTDFVRVNGVNEVIFCANDMASQDIISNMLQLVSTGVDYKIAPPDSLSVIGSNSIDTQGELYTVEISAISKPTNRRKKRIFDVIATFLLFVFTPFLVLFRPHRINLIKHALLVLVGRMTWVGYASMDNPELYNRLPKVARGVFPASMPGHAPKTNEEAFRINLMYARSFKIQNDLILFVNHFFTKQK